MVNLINSQNFVKTLIISMSLNIGLSYGSVVELPSPDELHSGMTTERSLSGIYLDEQRTMLFSENAQYLVMGNFKLDGKNRESRFGQLTDQKKINLTGAVYPGQWKGAYTSKDRIFIWDASMLQILVLRMADFKSIYSTTIPTDRIRPAADRMGEPTNIETQKTRSKFKENSRKIFGAKYTGLTELPEKWYKGADRKFFVTSNIEGFPLMIMDCKKDDAATCVLERQCFVEGKNLKNVMGIGVVNEERKIIIGDHEQNEINVFKYNSCFDVVYQRTLKLPSRLSRLKDITVDKEGRLVVVTSLIDQFTNGNVFFWEHEVWSSRH